MNEKEKTPASEKKGTRIVKAVLNTFINILIVIVLLTSVLIATLALTSKANGISNIFGMTIQTIQSDSMKGSSPDGYKGGDFQNGDLVFGRATGFDDYAEYQVGDIVTFIEKNTDGENILIAHRIVDKVTDEEGFYRYQTWGDNRAVSEVPDQLSPDQYLPAYEIASLIHSESYDAFILRGVGKALDYIRTPNGFFFVVLVPMLIFFLYELFRVAVNAQSYKKAKAQEQQENEQNAKQAEIDAAVKAALEAQNAAQTAPESQPQPEVTESPAPAAPEMSAEEYEEFKRFMAFKKSQEDKASLD